MRVVFAGTPEFALPALEALSRHHQVAGVLTQPDRGSGRGRHLSASPVKRAALALQLPLEQPETLRGEAALEVLRAWQPEVLVVVAYGLILPRPVLELPRLGCLNIHASLLPRWRGAAPIQRAILAGDTDSGVSIMQMDAGLDTGPVLLTRRVEIPARATSRSLHDQLAQLGAAALLEVLDGLKSGTVSAVPQPQDGVTYAAKIAKSESHIDWSLPAVQIDRQIRAFDPWPIAETTLGGESLRILAAEPLVNEAIEALKNHKDPQNGAIIAVRDGIMVVRCGTGYLGVQVVQRAGRRALPVRDFANSVRLEGKILG